MLIIWFVIGGAGLSGCAALSKSQMSTIRSFATSCDSFAKYPGAMFTEMAQIRAARGCFYAASLNDPLLRIRELNSLSTSLSADLALAKKMDISFEILNTYQRALKSLSHENRYVNTGREFRSLGRNLDSLVNKYNLLDISNPLPLGIGKAVGKIVGYGAELVVRNVQARAVREYVIEGDSLVSAVSLAIADILSSKSVVGLVENEAKGLEANYLSYLRSGKREVPGGLEETGATAVTGGRDFTGDREYLILLGRVNGLTKMRTGTISAAKFLARAHHKIAVEIIKRKKISQLFLELKELDDELYALRTGWERVTH